MTMKVNYKSDGLFDILYRNNEGLSGKENGIISSFDNASLFFLTVFGNLTFSLNFLGLISMSEYSKKFLIVITWFFNEFGAIVLLLSYIRRYNNS